MAKYPRQVSAAEANLARSRLLRVAGAAIDARGGEQWAREDPARAMNVAMDAMRATLGLKPPAKARRGK